MVYYCINAEFYDAGKVKVCMTEKQSKEKPNNQFKRKFGMSAVKIWFEYETFAKQVLTDIENREIDLDNLLLYFNTKELKAA